MDFLNKAKKTLLESVGIGDNIPADPALDALKDKINQLDSIISVLKKNFHKYSAAVVTLTQTSSLVANDVAQFYSRSKTRQPSIQRFVEANNKVDSVANDVFRDQFHRDILVTFDKWQRQVQNLGNNMKLAEELHVSLIKQDLKLRQAKDPSSRKGRAEMGPSIGDMENELAFTKTRLDTLKNKLESEINQAVENRYLVFDNILVRLMECQVEFFAGSSTALEQLKPNVENYRKRFPRGSMPDSLANESDESKPEQKSGGPSGMDDPLANSSSAPASAAKPSGHHHHSHKKIHHKESQASSAADEYEEEEEEEEESEAEESPVAAPTKPAAKPATAPAKPTSSGDVMEDLLGFGSVPVAKSNPAPSQAKPRPATNTAVDPTDLLFGGSGTASPVNNSKKPPSSSSGNNLSSLAGNDTKPTKTTKPKTTLKNKPSNPAVSSAPAPSPAASKPAAAPGADPEAKGSGMSSWETEVKEVIDNGPIDDEANKVQIEIKITKAKQKEIDEAARKAREQFHEKTLAEEKLNAEKRNARLVLEEKLDAWEFKQGTRKNIRTLLTTVHQVLWDGAGVDAIPLSSLMTDAGVKKAHRSVVLKCHPDRAKGNAEQEVIAERVFNALNTQYELFKTGAQQ